MPCAARFPVQDFPTLAQADSCPPLRWSLMSDCHGQEYVEQFDRANLYSIITSNPTISEKMQTSLPVNFCRPHWHHLSTEWGDCVWSSDYIANSHLCSYCTSQNSLQGEFSVLILRSWNFAEWFPALKVDINWSKITTNGLWEDLQFPGTRWQNWAFLWMIKRGQAENHRKFCSLWTF